MRVLVRVGKAASNRDCWAFSQVGLRGMSQTGANVRRPSRDRGWTAAAFGPRPLLVRAVRGNVAALMAQQLRDQL
jgi:hypothetical protein